MREVADLKGFTEISAAQISLDILIVQTEYKNTVINLFTLQFPHVFCNKQFVILKKKKKNNH